MKQEDGCSHSGHGGNLLEKKKKVVAKTRDGNTHELTTDSSGLKIVPDRQSASSHGNFQNGYLPSKKDKTEKNRLIQEKHLDDGDALSSHDADQDKTKQLKLEPTCELLFAEQNSSPNGINTSEAELRIVHYGLNKLPEKRVNPIGKYFSFMWNPLSWTMEIGAIVSLIILDWLDMVLIIALLFCNATIAWYEERTSGKAVKALQDQLAHTCRCYRDNVLEPEFLSERIVPGDVILLRLGDMIPADCYMAEVGGYAKVDESSLTGESKPAIKHTCDKLYGGSIVKQGEFKALVYATGINTFFGYTSTLLNKSIQHSRFQKVLRTIAWFCIIQIVICAVIQISIQYSYPDPNTTYANFSPASSTVVIIVGGIPIAMPTVLSVMMALGALNLAKQKAIVVRLTAIEQLASMNVLCSDKTGTLTLNHLTVQQPIQLAPKTYTIDDITFFGVIASQSDTGDAIDLALLEYVPPDIHQVTSSYNILEYHPFDPVDKWTYVKVQKRSNSNQESKYNDHWGDQPFYAAKGAPQIILSRSDSTTGLKRIVNRTIIKLARRGFRTIGISHGNSDGKNWKMIGLIPLFDPPRKDTLVTIQETIKLGVSIKMITGDQLAIAIETSKQLGIGSNIIPAKVLKMEPGQLKHKYNCSDIGKLVENADGFAQVLPEDKYFVVETLQKKKYIVGMTGDGVNDAVALKRADVGIAVSGATDAARASADIVLVEPGLSIISSAIVGSRMIFQRMKSYTIYSISASVRIVWTFTLLATIFNYNFPTIAIICFVIINDGTMIVLARDNATPSQNPETWRLKEIFIMAIVNGIYLTVSTIVFYILIRYSNMFTSFGLSTLDNAQLSGVIYLQVSITGLALIFFSRTTKWVFQSHPCKALIVVFIVAQSIASVLGAYGLGGFEQSNVSFGGGGWSWVLATWIYSIIWIIPLDFIKHAMQALMSLHIGINQFKKPWTKVTSPQDLKQSKSVDQHQEENLKFITSVELK